MRRLLQLAAFALLVGVAWRPAGAADVPAMQHVVPSALPAALPLRRDAAAGDEDRGWKGPLGFLLLAGMVGAWAGWQRLGRRRTHAPSASVVRVSSQALTAHASLHAVQWNGEELLLACTSQQVSIVARRTAVPPPEAGA